MNLSSAILIQALSSKGLYEGKSISCTGILMGRTAGMINLVICPFPILSSSLGGEQAYEARSWGQICLEQRAGN